MSRAIVTSNRTAEATLEATPGTAPAAPDDYKDRLLKYIPADVVAVYMAVAGIIAAAEESPDVGGIAGPLHWVVFLILLAATPIYLKRVLNVVSFLQIAITTIAYVVWVYYLGGPFKEIGGFHNELVAAILLPLFTFLVPIIKPEA